jgi:hypothetical protein
MRAHLGRLRKWAEPDDAGANVDDDHDSTVERRDERS